MTSEFNAVYSSLVIRTSSFELGARMFFLVQPPVWVRPDSDEDDVDDDPPPDLLGLVVLVLGMAAVCVWLGVFVLRGFEFIK